MIKMSYLTLCLFLASCTFQVASNNNISGTGCVSIGDYDASVDAQSLVDSLTNNEQDAGYYTSDANVSDPRRYCPAGFSCNK